MLKKEKKIVFVTYDYGTGGIQRVMSHIGNTLSGKNSVSFYSQKNDEPFYFLKGELYKENTGSKLSYFIFKVVKKLNALIGKKKIYLKYLKGVIRSNHFDTMVVTGNLMLATRELKHLFPEMNIILWMHNNYQVYLGNYYKNGKQKLIESMQVADKVVVLTDVDKVGFGQYSNNVIKISNPLTLDEHQRVSNLDKKIISISCRYAIEHKGLDYLVQIAKTIPDDWKIAVAGSGSPEEVKEFEALISKAGVTYKFILRGALSGDDLLKHYQDSSIYVMTSRWEGMPLVLAEAMSFGLPIISFENSGANEVLENGKDGILVEQGNVEEFSRQLNRLIESKELREEYSKKSLERVKDFSIEKIIKQWEEII